MTLLSPLPIGFSPLPRVTNRVGTDPLASHTLFTTTGLCERRRGWVPRLVWVRVGLTTVGLT